MASATMLREGVRTESRPDGTLPGAAQERLPHACFVAPYAWPVLAGDSGIKVVGGAEVQQTILARLFRRAGYRVSMICLDFGQPDGAEVDGIVVRKTFGQDEGIPVLRFFHPRLTAMWRVMSEVDADIYYQRSAARGVARFARQ